MWILIFTVSLLLSLPFYYLAWKFSSFEDQFSTIAFIFSMVTLISVVGICFTSLSLARYGHIDEKIAMYTEENQNIEKQIDEVVQNYMAYESRTFEEHKPENCMAMVTIYPELKSDSMIKEQIKVYSKNKAIITKLKETKISLKTTKWWLYFGE